MEPAQQRTFSPLIIKPLHYIHKVYTRAGFNSPSLSHEVGVCSSHFILAKAVQTEKSLTRGINGTMVFNCYSEHSVGCVLSPTLAQTQKHIMHSSTANIQELKLNSMSMYTHTQRKVFQSFVKSALQLRKHGFQSMYMHIHVYTCTDVCMWHLTLLDIEILITICKCT